MYCALKTRQELILDMQSWSTCNKWILHVLSDINGTITGILIDPDVYYAPPSDYRREVAQVLVEWHGTLLTYLDMQVNQTFFPLRHQVCQYLDVLSLRVEEWHNNGQRGSLESIALEFTIKLGADGEWAEYEGISN